MDQNYTDIESKWVEGKWGLPEQLEVERYFQR